MTEKKSDLISETDYTIELISLFPTSKDIFSIIFRIINQDYRDKTFIHHTSSLYQTLS